MNAEYPEIGNSCRLQILLAKNCDEQYLIIANYLIIFLFFKLTLSKFYVIVIYFKCEKQMFKNFVGIHRQHMKTLKFIFDSNFCIMQHHVFASLWIKDHSHYVRWNVN
jgi:hypothetical protein